MEYMNVVRSDFEEFAKENVEDYENSKTLLVRCHCIDYNDKFFFM